MSEEDTHDGKDSGTKNAARTLEAQFGSDDYPHFSEFADDTYALTGERKEIADVLNTKILITGYRISRSKYKEGEEYLTIQYKNDNEEYITHSGSTVLMNQIRKYKEKIPFYTTIKQISNYYAMT